MMSKVVWCIKVVSFVTIDKLANPFQMCTVHTVVQCECNCIVKEVGFTWLSLQDCLALRTYGSKKEISLCIHGATATGM